MKRAFALALLAIAPLAACAAISDDDTASQEANHTAGDPTYAQNEWLWANETADEFRTNAGANAWMGEVPEYLPLDHPMTQRLQFWMDRLDEALRAANPEKLTNVPKPQVIIQKSAVINAWVSPLPVNWHVRVRLEGGQAADAGSDAEVDAAAFADAAVDPDAGAPVPAAPPPDTMLLYNNGQVWAPGSAAIDRPHTTAKLDEFAKFINDGFAKCRAKVVDETFVLGEGCMRGDPAMPPEAPELQYYATSRFITFTSAYILLELDEDRLIATMAHEMGHFYRSHINMPVDAVNYFYSLDQSHTHKPEPDPRTLEQTAKVRAKLRGEIAITDWNEENALMKERRLGFYTIEQEADEIGLELMAKIGVPPSVSIEDMFGFLAKYPESSVGGTDYAECAAQRENGFRDDNGNLVSPPVGDPSNTHHNSCFRIFNMQQEINAHRYAIGTRPTPPGEAWSTLISRFGVENAPAAPPAPPPIADAGTD